MKPELIIDAPILGQKRIWVKVIEKPYFDHPFHFHKLCELTWVEKGSGKLVLGDYLGSFGHDELILSSPELPHLWKCDPEYYKEEAGMMTKAVGLYFPAEFISNLCDEEQVVQPYIQMMRTAERGIRFYGESKAKAIAVLHRLRKAGGLIQLGLFLELMGILSSSQEFEVLTSVAYTTNAYNPYEINRFNNVYQFLLEEFHRDISLEEVAALCSMSPNAFCRFFKQKTQKTFVQFLHEIRIGHAKKLLIDPDKAIKDICYECGYNNPVNFFHFFKKITGLTPLKYRSSIGR